MSADNWTTCPKCKRMTERTKQKQISNVRSAYGKLPPEKYETALFESRSLSENPLSGLVLNNYCS